MQIPIYVDGKEEGQLTIEREGATTVMDARLRDMGRVVRLSVFGEREAYLGVPEPEEGQLRLVRRLTPNDMRRFPSAPEYAADRRIRGEAPASQAAENKTEVPAPARHVLWQGGKPYYF